MTLGIRLESVTKRYSDRAVVDSLDLEAEPSRSLVILGPSGSGKTTTLRIVAGLLAPDEGRVTLGDTLANDPKILLEPRQRRVGMVFQTLALWPHMSVAGNLSFVIRGDDREDRIEKVLNMVNLWERRDSMPAELSGGEQQRVALARALVTDPGVLLLDEPLANLDEGLRKAMLQSMRELRERIGLTTVFVTHSQEEALAFADRVVIMDQGRNLQTGTPEEVYRNPRTRFVAEFLGAKNILDGEAAEDGSINTPLGDLQETRASGAGPVKVMLRPEDLLLKPAGEGKRGVVKGSSFQGSTYSIAVQVGEMDLVAVTPHAWEIGTEVELAWRREPVLLEPDE